MRNTAAPGSRIFFLLQALLSAALFCSVSAATAEESPQREVSPAFTNKDLEQYKPQSAAETPADDPAARGSVRTNGDQKPDKRQRAETASDRREQEYWCKKARQIRKGLTLAQDEVHELTARLKELSTVKAQTTGKKLANIDKQHSKTTRDLKAAGKRLKERQETLAELEDDAHRNNIPPGWLRCQFE